MEEDKVFVKNTLKGLGSSFQSRPATAGAYNHFRLARNALILLAFRINAEESWKLRYSGWEKRCQREDSPLRS